ncbi:MAG: ABC transporter permease [Oscillospiraceae bacterium]|jgi:peptide/nickel transport system permease protein|nr:ABC transporter permease [Oscillospiraceae bacterium]
MEDAVKGRSYSSQIWRQLKKSKITVISMIVLVVILLVAIFAPLLAPHTYEVSFPDRALEGPSRDFPLGTDRIGRCVLSRLLYGARQSLAMGVFSVTISTLIGVFLGAVAGYFGGLSDGLIMRILDVFQGIPMFLLTVTLAAVLGPSLQNAIIAIGITMIPGNARLIRASILSVREMEYIEAAKSIDASSARIIIKHIIPNSIAPVLVSFTMAMGGAVLSGAGLSFIGLGVQPPIPEWGAMISEGRNFMRAAPQLALYPGICVMITVIAFNMLGDGLRDALDPRLKS